MLGTWGDQETFVKHVIQCQLKWQLKYSHSQITAHMYIYVHMYLHTYTKDTLTEFCCNLNGQRSSSIMGMTPDTKRRNQT
jgi:hypothetical protein